MKLSELTYQVVKNVKYLDDAGFTYSSFLNRDYDGDQDYVISINNAIAPINEAIHRLSDRNKLAYKIATIGIQNTNLVDITSISKRIKKIKSVFYFDGADYSFVGFREYGKGFILLSRLVNKELTVQYIEDIPPFKLNDIYDVEKDIDLATIGVSETMCDYIIEYAQGKLQEPIEPVLANMHVTRAEQYFDDLEEQQTFFSQGVVHNKYRI